MDGIQALDTQALMALRENKQAKTLRDGLMGQGKDMTSEQARKVAVEFEGMFLGQMLQPLFENISADAPFGGGNAEKMWQSMMVDEYGKALAQRGGIGLADDIQRQILQLQEVK